MTYTLPRYEHSKWSQAELGQAGPPACILLGQDSGIICQIKMRGRPELPQSVMNALLGNF